MSNPDCYPLCEDCVYYDRDSARNLRVATMPALCYKHKEMTEVNDRCPDFFCRHCTKKEFCKTVPGYSDKECPGCKVDENDHGSEYAFIHPMCTDGCKLFRSRLFRKEDENVG